MEENLNFSPEQESASEQPSAAPKKKSKLIALIASAAAVVICAAVLICGAAFGWFAAKSPFAKTMNAVFPSTELFGDLLTKGGSLTVEGEIANDLLGDELKSPICFSADYACSLDSTLFKLTAGTEDDRIDLTFLADKEGVQAYSDRLLGNKAYGISFDGLMDAIDASPFAPNSGTEYALPEEVYDLIKEFADTLKEEDRTFAETTKAFSKATDAMLEQARVSAKEETVSLISGDTQADVTTYIFSADGIKAFYKTLESEWKNNDAFRNEIEAFDTEGTLVSFIESVLEELEMRDASLFEKDFELSVKYAVKDGYFVYADLLISKTDVFGPNNTFFVIKFTENPKKDPRFDIRYSTAQDGIETGYWHLTYRTEENGDKETWQVLSREKNASMVTRQKLILDCTDHKKTVARISSQAGQIDDSKETSDYAFETLYSVEIEGKLKKRKTSIDMTIDAIEMTDSAGETQFEMKDSSFRISIESGKSKSKRRGNGTDVLRMSATELDELGATLEESLQNALESIGEKLGIELVHDTYQPNALATLALPENATDYAYDRTNGHLFVVIGGGLRNEVVMYDLATMEKLGSFRSDGAINAIDADSGYLALTYDRTKQHVAHVYSSETLEFVKSFDYGDDRISNFDFPGDVMIDGNTLAFITGDGHSTLFFTDIKTGEQLNRSTQPYEGKFSIDRDNHILSVLENNLSACDILFYSTHNGELIKKFDGFGKNEYMKGAAYFDGNAFWVANEWYLPNGSNGKLKQALDLATHGELLAVVFRDENIVVTLETDGNGMPCTAFYLPDGTFSGSVSELYTLITKADDGHYLAAVTEGNQTSFQYCELVKGKSIMF